MTSITIPLQSYELGGLAGSAERLVNLYAEAMPAESGRRYRLRSTPGLTPLFAVGPGPIRAIDASLQGQVYVVSGDRLIRLRPQLDGDAAREDLGAIGAGGYPTIATGTLSTVVCSPPNAFICDHGGALHQITGTAEQPFPGASSVATLDGYFVFTALGNGNQFFCSGLLDGDRYDGLDFAHADLRPNVVRRVMTFGGELWMIGENGFEVWYDAGGADFPFARRAGADIAVGCTRYRTVAACDGSLFWLGRDGIVYRSQGYQARRVSTHAIEEWVRGQPGDPALADGFAYTQDGHSFYCLTVQGPGGQGGAGRTWVYDCATELWHERASGAGGTGPWRGGCAALTVYPLIGDRSSNAIHLASPAVNNDGGQVLTRIATTPPLRADAARAFMARLDLEMEVGGTPGASLALECSDDGGYSYGPARLADTGAAGARRHRVAWTRLGSFRQRVLRFSIADQLTLYGADAQMEAGQW